MSKAGVSLTVYSVYLGASGVGLALIPNTLLHVLGIPPTREGWVRLFGSLAAVLAAKGFYAARLNLVPSLQFDVYTRTVFGVFLTVLVVLDLVPRVMIIFAIIDILAAVWTEFALRADRRAATS